MEEHLTKDRLRNMRGPELVRLNPTRVAPELLPMLINQLFAHHDLEAAVVLFEKIGLSPELVGHWDDALWQGTRLLLADEDKDPVLGMVELGALAALRDNGDVKAVTLAYDLIDSRYRALGILVARGAVAIADDLEALTLLEALLETRDKLHLPPEDPIEEPAAFAGVKRIKTIRDLWRQRIVGDYRLLFRLRPEVLEVVALINRRDLEKKIKSL